MGSDRHDLLCSCNISASRTALIASLVLECNSKWCSLSIKAYMTQSCVPERLPVSYSRGPKPPVCGPILFRGTLETSPYKWRASAGSSICICKTIPFPKRLPWLPLLLHKARKVRDRCPIVYAQSIQSGRVVLLSVKQWCLLGPWKHAFSVTMPALWNEVPPKTEGILLVF